MKKGCKKGFMIGLYVFYSLVGNYFLTSGLVGSWNPSDILTSQIFWGIALILVGIFHGTKILLKK